jgi:4-hydroxy-3-methylbut-2-en-1-yl diphosphate reductase
MAVMIEKAKELGFCFGVRRAIKLIEGAARKQQGITTLGPIVHNRLVVARLAAMGVKSINNLDEFKGGILAIPSHGVSPEVLERITMLHVDVIDTTCPNVRSAQKAAKQLSEGGFSVIIFGEATHPEVRALVGWAGNKAIATLENSDIAGYQPSDRLGILSQTTQSKAQFTDFTSDLLTKIFPDVHEVRVINTLCDETQKRQTAAFDLARKSDLMIVVGGRNSANTQRLADVCSPITETHLIETADEIETIWLSGKRQIGITAGASTPDEAIAEVAQKLVSQTRDT